METDADGNENPTANANGRAVIEGDLIFRSAKLFCQSAGNGKAPAQRFEGVQAKAVRFILYQKG